MMTHEDYPKLFSEICSMNPEQKNKRNKRILLFSGVIFTVLVILTTWDIMRRTSPPGSKKHLPHSILK
jgi:predicted nucleic acid-binding Zn ribbon protein